MQYEVKICQGEVFFLFYQCVFIFSIHLHLEKGMSFHLNKQSSVL